MIQQLVILPAGAGVIPSVNQQININGRCKVKIIGVYFLDNLQHANDQFAVFNSDNLFNGLANYQSIVVSTQAHNIFSDAFEFETNINGMINMRVSASNGGPLNPFNGCIITLKIDLIN